MKRILISKNTEIVFLFIIYHIFVKYVEGTKEYSRSKTRKMNKIRDLSSDQKFFFFNLKLQRKSECNNRVELKINLGK